MGQKSVAKLINKPVQKTHKLRKRSRFSVEDFARLTIEKATFMKKY